MAKKELWRVVKGYPNYSISNYGSFKNNKTGDAIAFDPNEKGYFGVRLRDIDEVKRRLSIHRLVKTTFDPQEIDNTIQIHHIDGDKYNNHISNLKYVTREEHVRLEGKEPLTEKQVMQIVDYLEMGLRNWEISQLLEISKQQVSSVKTGTTWSSITGIKRA